MFLQEIFSKIEEITDNVCCKYIEFGGGLDEIILSESLTYNHANHQQGSLRNLFKNIDINLGATINNSRNNVHDLCQTLKNKHTEVVKLEKTLKQLTVDLNDQNRQIQEVKDQIKIFDNDELHHLKCCIKAYKLLTSATFVFQASDVQGYVKGKTSLDFEVFSFNTEQKSQEKLTKHLWTLMENVAKRNNKNNETYREDKM